MTDTTTPLGVEPTPEPAPVHGDEQCVQCTQTDNHPKVHVLTRGDDGGLTLESHHFDCLPHQLRREDLAASPHMESVYHKALVEGVRGEQLRAHIAEVHAALPQAPYVTGPHETTSAPDASAAATTDTTQGA